MASSCVMKQIQEKALSFEICKSAWSPKMDLIAIANNQGQVSLHRLSWQRVWSFNSPNDKAIVTALVWRPDSKVLAIGYSLGDVCLVDVEDANLVLNLKLEVEVTALSWVLYSHLENGIYDYSKDESFWSKYLIPLPPLSKSYTASDSKLQKKDDCSWNETKLLTDQKEMTLLCIGTISSNIHFYAFGLFHCASINLDSIVCGAGKVVDVLISNDLNLVSVIVERKLENNKIEMGHVALESQFLALKHKEIKILSLMYGHIYSLLSYASCTINHIAEAWENILLEMDVKLSDYSNSVQEGGVSADFLDMLVFGYATPEFEIFLTSKVTDKGLRKLSESVVMSYSSMKKLVAQNLQAVGQSLIFLLTQLKGMARCEDHFEVLGLEEPVVMEAIREAGAFLLKSSEVLQVIESSMKDFQSFLRWLSSVLLKLLKIPVRNDLCETTQQELTHIANFLYENLEETFIGANGQKKTRFRLEKVEQYLKDDFLSVPFKSCDNSWIQFLNSNSEFCNHQFIIPRHEKLSLIQEHANLSKVLDSMAQKPLEFLSSMFKTFKYVSLCAKSKDASVLSTQLYVEKDSSIYSVLIPEHNKHVYFLSRWLVNKELNDECVQEHYNIVSSAPYTFIHLESGSSLNDSGPVFMLITDAQFYNENTVSFLLRNQSHSQAAYFVQLPLRPVVEELSPLSLPERCSVESLNLPLRDCSTYVDPNGYRQLDFGTCRSLAVSGSRKVALIVAENKQRLRIYEMEADEDEDDDDGHHASVMNASGTSDDHNDAT